MSRRASTLDLDITSKYSTLGGQAQRRSTTLSSQSQPKTSKPGDVLCDFCTTRKQKAVKSCLLCLASYCETHLQSHYEYPALMKHKLVKATGQMREKICAQHDKLLEVFCRTDQTSVCVLCMMDEHKRHDTVPAGTERVEKQKQLGSTLMKSQQRIDQRVKKWTDLRQAVESVKHSAQAVLDENERIFTELLRSIERRYIEVRELVRAQEKTTVIQAEGLLDRLEEEITLLRKKHTDLEKLSHTDDHIHFLQSWQSLSGPSGYEDLNNVTVVPYYSFDGAKRAIAALKVQVEEINKTEISKIASADLVQPTLDVNSAHPNLYLSEGNTVAKMMSEPKNYPDHPDRFDHWQQLLCKEGLSGSRCYWEVDWRGTEIDIAVTFQSINRKGNSNECSLGWNDKSWSLYCSEDKYSFVHKNQSTDIAKPRSSRVGVYVDQIKGTLAFYSVSDSMNLLHKVQTTFIEPLYPAFSVWGFGSSVKLV
ncbi:tripartite motif-containing protein 16 [Salvelinus namaycush]|uniref:Tripartite motif-containing protein 16 n=1 Tax=Salvelinus namaycush TaxID=8040 RepID=A0A8U0QNT4_SALNM|nr:tripartite motif-containing protein 16 [Salvelinus namaycush]